MYLMKLNNSAQRSVRSFERVLRAYLKRNKDFLASKKRVALHLHRVANNEFRVKFVPLDGHDFATNASK